MPSPGSVRIAGTRMGLGINDSIGDFGVRIWDCFDLRFWSKGKGFRGFAEVIGQPVYTRPRCLCDLRFFLKFVQQTPELLIHIFSVTDVKKPDNIFFLIDVV